MPEARAEHTRARHARESTGVQGPTPLAAGGKRGPGKKKRKKLSAKRWEVGALGGPSYDVDTGLAIGGFLNVARFWPGYRPYFWRLLFTFNVAMRLTPEGIEIPLQGYGVKLDLPGLLGGAMRLRLDATFNSNILQYFGIGNASDGTRVWEAYDPETQFEAFIRAYRRYQYRRIAPRFRADVLFTLAPSWFLYGSAALQYQHVTLVPGSKLEEDWKHSQAFLSTKPDVAMASLLRGVQPHWLTTFQVGLLWDTRNDEFTPSKGGLHGISLRGSPGPLLGTRYAFWGANITLRMYVSLWKDIIVLALRGMGDLLFGQVPFYLLTSFGGLFGAQSFGGQTSLRGIRAQRYHGKAKLLGNLELRAMLVSFWRIRLGLVAYLDAGRVWADYGRYSALDGASVGIKWGVGGGIRAKWGKALIIRIDVAWSQDANPVGFYFNIGQTF